MSYSSKSAIGQGAIDQPSAATIDAAMKRAHQLRSNAFRHAAHVTASLVARGVGSMTMQRPFLTMTRHSHQASPCQ